MERGCILGNRYEIVDTLGSGGMGRVYLAKNIALGTLWAIKELKKSSGTIDRVLTEVNVLKNLEHPLLPKVFDVIETTESFFVVFTYLKGLTLSQSLAEVGRFDEETVIRWGICLCDVLSYLHNLKPNPIIYRDLKPSNIMLCHDGIIKLIDFGIAREFKDENTQDTVFIGTRGYAAPEQYGQGQSGPYTDIFSLGVTLKQLLTGKSPLSPPYGIVPVAQLNPQVSKKLSQIIEKCTCQEIEKRYSCASDLKDEFISLTIKGEGRGSKAKNTQTIIRTENKAFYKQTIISLDNAEFTSELAIAASSTGMSVLLVDIARFTPASDFYLGIQKQYKEYRVMMGLEASGLESIEVYGEDTLKYIFVLPQVEHLNFLALNVIGLNEANILTFLNSIKGRFDLVILSTYINYLSTKTKALFDIPDRILITQQINFNYIDYWKRVIYSASREFEIQLGKITYFAWLYDKSEGVLLKLAKELLDDINFEEGISLKNRRCTNLNDSIAPAILNYSENRKEYSKILYSLRISPVGYIECPSRGLFRFLMAKRVQT